MIKDFILQTYLTALDALQNCKDVDPKRFSFYARADGQEFGELPLDIQRKMEAAPRKIMKPRSELVRKQWASDLQLAAVLPGVLPGAIFERTLPSEDEARLALQAIERHASIHWGGLEFVGHGERDGCSIRVTRRKTPRTVKKNLHTTTASA